MLLLATLMALFAERLAPKLAEHRSLAWFERYMTVLVGRLKAPGWLVLTALVIPWALLAMAVQSFLHGVLWGLLELAFTVLVLFWALRPGGVDPAIDGYVAAREKGDDATARHHAEDLLGGSVPQAVEEEMHAVVDTLLLEANERWFAPLVWFVLLGPLGALTYRLTAHVEQHSESGSLYEAAHLLRAALDWLPARLLAAMYILSGSFEEGLNAWQNQAQIMVDMPSEAKVTRALELEQANRELLLRVGRAALRSEEYSITPKISDTGAIEADASIVRAARGLVLRSLIALVAIIALLTLGGWIA